ncbi:MAG: hypothetical protein CVV61_08810, partial [Tenericutes bacterium HGW-Tenericutes-6]
MEYVGYDPNTVHSTIHTTKFNHNLGTQIGFSKDILNAETEFHDYEMIWAPGYIKTLVDGETIGEFNYVPGFTSDVPYDDAFPFDQEFFLIINLAIGGNWGGAQGVDDSIFPTSLEVDYARVYKLDYATLDKVTPSAPTGLSIAQLENTLYWQKADDDYGVENYAVYLDGEFHKYVNLNQARLTGLVKNQTYQVQISAVDFVGRESELSESLSLTYN